EEGKLADVRTKKAQSEAQKVADWLAEHELLATLKIGGEGKAFGAVTAKDLEILLRRAGMEVDRRRIQLSAPLKRLGVFEIPLAIHPEVPTVIKLFVDRQGGSKDGARDAQAAWEAAAKVREEAEKAEAEARAAREAEAEEAARIAVERAAARKAREEEEAKAREEARQGKPLEGMEEDGEPKAETDAEPQAEPEPAAAEPRSGDAG
ncbi:MAG TPA: 50S ribosomal L9 C-terminal domain-containing protein, partial [bacterium]|nr:50S ribosomal L9 C-terminal domain-containing protein [bacterium]